MYRILFLFLLLPLWSVADVNLPSDYVGIEIYQSTIDDVSKKLGKSLLQSIPYGHHENGYCYVSDNGIYAAFSSGPMGAQSIITRMSIHLDNPGLKCSPSKLELPTCIGEFCLGVSKNKSESLLGGVLDLTSDGSNSYVKSFWLTRELTEEEKQKLNLSEEMTVADIINNIWFKFENEEAIEIGIIKFETY
ncbi:hypothetical protein [Vibrio parahaemolyticus]|uniref:hypothetical protein n=1 Tax=Vibrio parahaemolyticus TaxID=670 RepID=UPI0011238A9E|nr:hypothetical protein [Vibrio parahaemolyticus]MBE3752945.1 hypothetical protein [Vibrio parahaemolyticus]TOK35722.1 hypothetical protein CGI21_23080 [Vibrio parahaemolyticus]